MIKDPLDTVLQKQLDYLKLPYCQENFRSLAAEANTRHWTHLDYLARLVEGEAAARQDRAVLHPRQQTLARSPPLRSRGSFMRKRGLHLEPNAAAGWSEVCQAGQNRRL